MSWARINLYTGQGRRYTLDHPKPVWKEELNCGAEKRTSIKVKTNSSKKAKENQKKAIGGDRKSNIYKNQGFPNLENLDKTEELSQNSDATVEKLNTHKEVAEWKRNIIG